MRAAALRIRHAEAADAEPLARCMAEWFLAAYGEASDPVNTAAFVATHFGTAQQAREIADPSVLTLIAESDDGSWAGYAQLRFATPAPACVAEDDTVELGRFYFAPSQHGRGGAAQLMQALRAEASARSRRWLWLLVWQHAPQAIRFYEKQSFEKVGTAVFLVGSDEKADWIMRAPVALPS